MDALLQVSAESHVGFIRRRVLNRLADHIDRHMRLQRGIQTLRPAEYRSEVREADIKRSHAQNISLDGVDEKQ